MIGNALDLTLQNRKEMFVLFDDSGKLTLKNISSMRVGTSDNPVLVMLSRKYKPEENILPIQPHPHRRAFPKTEYIIPQNLKTQFPWHTLPLRAPLNALLHKGGL